MPRMRLIVLTAIVSAGLFPGADAAIAGQPSGESADSDVAFVDVVVAEQAMDHRGRPAGPKRLVELRRDRTDKKVLRAASERSLARTKVDLGPTSRSLQSVGCKTIWATRIGRSWFGSVLWKFTQEKYFCWSTPRITTVRVNSYPCCTDPFWHWKGHIGKRAWYFGWSGNIRGGHYSFRQGKFRQDFVKFSLSTKQPWVKLWVYGNGDWAYRTGS